MVPKNYQSFTQNNLYCLLAIEKKFEVKPKFDRHVHSKPNCILLNSLILLRRYFHL